LHCGTNKQEAGFQIPAVSGQLLAFKMASEHAFFESRSLTAKSFRQSFKYALTNVNTS
jgi:hypothetical protein